MNSPREEFEVTVRLLEETMTQLGLLLGTLQRLEHELFPEDRSPEPGYITVGKS